MLLGTQNLKLPPDRLGLQLVLIHVNSLRMVKCNCRFRRYETTSVNCCTKGRIVHPSDYIWVWWNDIDRGTEELGERPVSVPLCPSQIPHGLTDANPGFRGERRRLTAWAMARPIRSGDAFSREDLKADRICATIIPFCFAQKCTDSVCVSNELRGTESYLRRYFFIIGLNKILPNKVKSSKLSLLVRFPTKVLYAFLISMRATWPVLLMVLDLTTIKLGEDYMLWSSSLCNCV
jgi:hypothetical protein